LNHWLQSDYIEGKQEIETGELIFKDIIFFEIKPSKSFIKDNEILEFQIIQDSSKQKEFIKIVVNSLDDVILFYIQANNVEWIINNYINVEE